MSKCLSNKLIFQELIIDLNLDPLPDNITFNLVDAPIYPIPPSITLTETILPSSKIGVRTAPTPEPVISISGGEL